MGSGGFPTEKRYRIMLSTTSEKGPLQDRCSKVSLGRFILTMRTKFDAKGCWDMLVLVANSFHGLDAKTKTIEAKQ